MNNMFKVHMPYVDHNNAGPCEIDLRWDRAELLEHGYADNPAYWVEHKPSGVKVLNVVLIQTFMGDDDPEVEPYEFLCPPPGRVKLELGAFRDGEEVSYDDEGANIMPYLVTPEPDWPTEIPC